MKKYLSAFLFLWVVNMAYAQPASLGNWLIYIGNKKIDNNWNWHNEVQYRNYNAVGDLEQLLLRTGFGKNLTEGNNNLLFGYGYILSQNYIENTDDKFDVNEHRIFQQFINKTKIGIVSTQHRYRFEQRWVEGDFRMRFRYFLALGIPLNKKEMVDGTLYASIYNEIFLNSKANVFDRNRLYTGLGYRLSSAVRVELGYMNQFLNNGNRDQVNMITFVSF